MNVNIARSKPGEELEAVGSGLELARLRASGHRRDSLGPTQERPWLMKMVVGIVLAAFDDTLVAKGGMPSSPPRAACKTRPHPSRRSSWLADHLEVDSPSPVEKLLDEHDSRSHG
jgi:hypothetical protein